MLKFSRIFAFDSTYHWHVWRIWAEIFVNAQYLWYFDAQYKYCSTILRSHSPLLRNIILQLIGLVVVLTRRAQRINVFNICLEFVIQGKFSYIYSIQPTSLYEHYFSTSDPNANPNHDCSKSLTLYFLYWLHSCLICISRISKLSILMIKPSSNKNSNIYYFCLYIFIMNQYRIIGYRFSTPLTYLLRRSSLYYGLADVSPPLTTPTSVTVLADVSLPQTTPNSVTAYHM